VVFPLEILTWILLGSTLFQSSVSFVALLLAQIVINHFLSWTVLLLPFVLVPLLFACLGISWFLASLGVYVRDIGQVTSVFTSVFIFVSAVFYPVSALPTNYQVWLRLNPIVSIITESRNVIVFGILPDWVSLFYEFIIGLAMAIAGFWWFQKTRKGFADVI
jgi:homopolymeric O-antigen transport system permease protein